MKKKTTAIQKKAWGTVLATGGTVLATGVIAAMLTACGGDAEPAAKPEKSNGSGEQIQMDGENRKLEPASLGQAMLDGEHSRIYAQFSEQFKGQVSGGDFADMSAEFTAGIKAFPESYVVKLNGIEQRIWVSDAGDKGILALFDEQAAIVGLQIQGLEQFPESDRKLTKITYDLPMKGDWFVFWGGTNVFANYHYEHPSQRYAYDFIQTKEGMSYEGDPAKNESYFAFGQEVVAPADGTVVEVVNDIPDNEPVGVMNEKAPAGNVVIIDHGGEFSYLAHLKKGSVAVKAGDQVKRGERIGEVGNSGNSSEAHMHFQVSDGSDLFNSTSVRIQWSGEMNPVRGETVQRD